MDKLVEGFQKFPPTARISTNYMTSSEGALGMMYAGVADVVGRRDRDHVRTEDQRNVAGRPCRRAVGLATGAVVGRLTLTRQLLRAIARASYFDIGAPNDMDEAWHVGRAEPLRRVAKTCLAH